MLYRTTAFFIVLFWLTMTALLVHQEVRPGDSALREIPVSHVVKLLLMHQQKSALSIYSDKLRLGQLQIEPSTDEQTQTRKIAFHGDLQIIVPGGKRERIGWKGDLEMDKYLTTRRFQVSVTNHAITDLTSQIEVLPAENIAHYELLSPNGTIEREDYTLDERGVRTALDQLGLDSSLFPIAQKQRAATAPTIKARLSSLPVHGENMDTYLITIESNGQTLLECHVDQLGHVVHVATLLGYTFSADDVTP